VLEMMNKNLTFITWLVLSINLVSCGGGGGGGSDQQASPTVNSTPVTPVAEKII
ncbi:uncharacterized protein METZ01_LOCUS208713, partial [marine metagenome]